MDNLNNKSKYTRKDYLQLHQYVIDYQNNIPEAADNIIHSFDHFIWKYVNFITGGIFPIDDFSLRRFLSLYMSNSTAKKSIHQYKFKTSIVEYIRDTASMVQSLFTQYSKDDIRNALILTLLNMAKRYKDFSKPSFHNYVHKCFHYGAYRTLAPLINNPSIKFEDDIDNTIPDLLTEQEYIRTLDKTHQDLLIKQSRIPTVSCDASPYDNKSLNLNWINGITCGSTFKSLTPFEREILIMSFIEKKTDTEIADKYGVCRATINRRKQSAIHALKQIIS